MATTPPAQPAGHQTVSVIIPVRNGADHLAEQLSALASQDLAGDLEVIIADNGSTDATVEIARSFRKRLPGLRVVDASARAGTNHARNRGVAASTGDPLLFCDSDDRAHTSWARHLVECLRDADAVGGELELDGLNPPELRAPIVSGVRMVEDFLSSPSGACCGITRAAYERTGPFDEDFSAGGDEVEFFWRLQLAGLSLVSCTEAVMAYRLRPGLRQAARQSFKYGRALPQLYRKFHDRGMPRSSLVIALKAWLLLLGTSPRVLWPSTRRTWVVLASWRAGRLAGSIRYRVLAP
jgi:glycosyltransferase involved in cell wall biosynthesis